MPNSIVGRDHSTEYQGSADDKKSVDCDVCVGVSDAVKDRVMFKQELEPVHIHVHREDEQKEGDRNREYTPRLRCIGNLPWGKRTGATGNNEEQSSYGTDRN